MNYAKILENGKVDFPRPVKTTSEDGLVVTYTSKSEAELVSEGYKKVYTHVSGRPGKDMKQTTSYEDKGEFILKNIVWEAK